MKLICVKMCTYFNDYSNVLWLSENQCHTAVGRSLTDGKNQSHFGYEVLYFDNQAQNSYCLLIHTMADMMRN